MHPPGPAFPLALVGSSIALSRNDINHLSEALGVIATIGAKNSIGRSPRAWGDFGGGSRPSGTQYMPDVLGRVGARIARAGVRRPGERRTVSVLRIAAPTSV